MDQANNCSFVYPFKYERFKVLKIIGQSGFQIVLDAAEGLDYPADHLIEGSVSFEECRNRPFQGKIVKQGVISKKITYCGLDERVRFQFSRAAFTIGIDIPGLNPASGLEMEDLHLLEEASCRLVNNNTVTLKAVISGEIRVSSWVEERLQVCTGNINYFGQISPRVSYRP